MNKESAEANAAYGDGTENPHTKDHFTDEAERFKREHGIVETSNPNRNPPVMNKDLNVTYSPSYYNDVHIPAITKHPDDFVSGTFNPELLRIPDKPISDDPSRLWRAIVRCKPDPEPDDQIAAMEPYIEQRVTQKLAARAEARRQEQSKLNDETIAKVTKE